VFVSPTGSCRPRLTVRPSHTEPTDVFLCQLHVSAGRPVCMFVSGRRVCHPGVIVLSLSSCSLLTSDGSSLVRGVAVILLWLSVVVVVVAGVVSPVRPCFSLFFHCVSNTQTKQKVSVNSGYSSCSTGCCSRFGHCQSMAITISAKLTHQ